MRTANVTVLFTDLVGSTDLLARLGEEAADELRREHFALLRAAVDEAGGREVKNLGDGVMVAFEGVTAALGCAIALQQAHAARPADREPLHVRVGVAMGEADVEEGDYFGLPVVEAARLCGRADGGQILTTEVVRMLSRSRGGFDMASIGEVELKGLAAPVKAFEVLWSPLTAEETAVVPIPARVASLADARLVGRGSERAALAVALKEAGEGQRRVVLVSGEPGIGKTSLSSWSAREAHREGAVVLYGRCDEDLFVPYQPWAEALAHLVEHAPDELIEDHVAACGPILARMVPRLAQRSGRRLDESSADDESDRHLLFSAVVDLVRRAAEFGTVVVLLDDLQWADAATVQLLRHVIGAVQDLRLVLLGTFRGSDVGRDHPLAAALAGLHREAGVERVALRGLGDDELLEWLEAVAGHEMDDDGIALRDALSAETEGNPFFVGELLRHLSETGFLYFDDEAGRWFARDDLRIAGLPVSIREVVDRRVAALGSVTEKALTMASVIGRDFDVALLAAVVDIDADELVDLCDAATEAALLRETDVPDRYTFAHGLIERSLYDGFSTSRRARAHRLVAEAIEELYDGDIDERVVELAHHWAQATRPQDAGKAVDYARRAGDRALAALAPDEALRWYEDGLDLVEDHQRSTRVGLELRIGLGEAQRLSGLPGHRETLLAAADDARAAGEPALLIRAALANSRGFASSIGDVDQPRIDVISAALDAADPGSADRARLLALLAAELHWAPDRFEERLQCAAAAVELARRIDDPRVFIEVVTLMPETRAVPETMWASAADTYAACDLADAHTDPVHHVRAHWVAGFAAIDTGDRARIDRHLDALQAAADRTGVPLHLWNAAMLEAMRMMLDGDADGVDRVASVALEASDAAGAEDGVIMWAANVIVAAWMRGQLESLLPMLDDSVADNPGLPIFQVTSAWAQACERNLDAVAEMVTAARADSFDMPRNQTWLLGQCFWAECAYRTGDAESAAILLPRLEPWPELLAGSHASVHMVVAHYAGLARATVGDLDDAIAHLEQAISLHRALRAPHFVACSEVALAEVLLRADTVDGDRVRGLATSALEVARARGYAYVERDALDVLGRVP